MTSFEMNKRKAKTASTRLYRPAVEKRDNAITLEESDEKELANIPTPVQYQREMTTFERGLIMFFSFLLASMIVFVLSGYERISKAYSDINTLNKSIDSVKLHISELNVAIECAVTIDDAEAAAIDAGMVYPTINQIHSSDDPLSPSLSSPTLSVSETEEETGEDGTNSTDLAENPEDSTKQEN